MGRGPSILRGRGARWVDTGIFYLPHQLTLTGPYEARTAFDVLYPPIALYLFVPFIYLPPAVWWLIPLGILTWHVLTCRPAWWIWPVLAVLIWFPRTQAMIIWGNTGIWLAAFVALGVAAILVDLVCGFRRRERAVHRALVRLCHVRPKQRRRLAGSPLFAARLPAAHDPDPRLVARDRRSVDHRTSA